MLDIRGRGISEIVHAPNLKNKIGAGSPCTIQRRVYAHSELEKFWRKSEEIRREKSEEKREKNGTQSYFALRFLLKAKPLAYGQCRKERFIISAAR